MCWGSAEPIVWVCEETGLTSRLNSLALGGEIWGRASDGLTGPPKLQIPKKPELSEYQNTEECWHYPLFPTGHTFSKLRIKRKRTAVLRLDQACCGQW